MSEKRARFEAMKRKLGQAPYGTGEYWLNAAKILSQWADSDGEMRADTRAKLVALSRSSDPETRAIAQRALLGYPYEDD